MAGSILDILGNPAVRDMLGGMIGAKMGQGGRGQASGGLGGLSDLGAALNAGLGGGRAQQSGGGLGDLGALGSVLGSVLGGGGRQAQAGGGLGDLGALGGLLRHAMGGGAGFGGNARRSSGRGSTLGMAALGMVAWNFYRKWKAMQAQAPSHALGDFAGGSDADPTAVLMLRAMVYAAKADGQIDRDEAERISEFAQQLLPGQEARPLLEAVLKEPADPATLAAQVQSPELAQDIYRLSSLIVEVDTPAERAYLTKLGQALNLGGSQSALDEESLGVKRQLGELV